MDNKMPAQQDETTITLEGDDGNNYSCQLIDIFEFEKQVYKLLDLCKKVLVKEPLFVIFEMSLLIFKKKALRRHPLSC